MIPTLLGEGFAVFDDFLPPDQHAAVSQFIAREDVGFVHDEGWSRAYPCSDNPSIGKTTYLSRPAPVVRCARSFPVGSAIDHLLSAITHRLYDLAPWLGGHGRDFDLFSARACLYPVGCGIGWHRHGRGASYSYYAHPVWQPSWGGELLILQPGNPALEKNSAPRSARFSFEPHPLDDAVMDCGLARAIWPKPNRMVVLHKGATHAVLRVQPAAGDHLRSSVTGFTLRDAALLAGWFEHRAVQPDP
jgi:hypothetical protein